MLMPAVIYYILLMLATFLGAKVIRKNCKGKNSFMFDMVDILQTKGSASMFFESVGLVAKCDDVVHGLTL